MGRYSFITPGFPSQTPAKCRCFYFGNQYDHLASNFLVTHGCRTGPLFCLGHFIVASGLIGAFPLRADLGSGRDSLAHVGLAAMAAHFLGIQSVAWFVIAAGERAPLLAAGLDDWPGAASA